MPDLNSKWQVYLVALKTAAPAAKDVTTLVAKDLATQRATAGGAANLDDANTMYFMALP